MAYSKQPKTIQDFGLGYQSVNQAADNEQALRDAYATEHFESDVITGFGLSAIPTMGHHDHVLIPRAIGVVKAATIGGASVITWFDLLSTDGGHVQQLIRLTAGVYLIPLAGVDASDTYVEVTPAGSSGVVRAVNSRFASQVQGAPFTGVQVLLYERDSSSGAMELADFEFTLALFSR